MKKRRWLFLIVTLLAIVSMISACAKAGPTSTVTKTETSTQTAGTTTASTTTTTSAVTYKPMKLTLASAFSPATLQAQESKYFMDEITKRSGGAITFDATFSAALAPPGELLGLVSKGAVDLIDWSPQYNGGLFPTADFCMGFPFTTSDPDILMPAGRKLRSEFPEWGATFDKQNVKVLTYTAHSFYGIISKKPLKTLDDFKGMKIAAIGISSKIIEATGAVGVSSGAQERYMQMQTGVVDANWLPMNQQTAYKIYEVGKYFLELDALTNNIEQIVMNLDKWKSLDAATQKLFLDVGLDAEAHLRTLAKKDYENGIATMKAAGVVMTQLSDAERTRWANQTPDLAKDVATLMESKGLPGTAIMKRYEAILKEAGVKLAREH